MAIHETVINVPLWTSSSSSPAKMWDTNILGSKSFVMFSITRQGDMNWGHLSETKEARGSMVRNVSIGVVTYSSMSQSTESFQKHLSISKMVQAVWDDHLRSFPQLDHPWIVLFIQQLHSSSSVAWLKDPGASGSYSGSFQWGYLHPQSMVVGLLDYNAAIPGSCRRTDWRVPAELFYSSIQLWRHLFQMLFHGSTFLNRFDQNECIMLSDYVNLLLVFIVYCDGQNKVLWIQFRSVVLFNPQREIVPKHWNVQTDFAKNGN